MRLRDLRIWAVLLAAAFLVLWCVSIGAGYAAPAAEPMVEMTATAEPLSAVGVWGWALIGVGALVVLLGIIYCNLPQNRRSSRRYTRRPRSIERRYY